MFQFSIVDKVGGRARTATKESFDEVIDRRAVAELCRRIAEQGSLAAGCPDQMIRDGMLKKVGEMKRSLPAFCWHATFRDGKRNSFSAIESGLVMMDIDHIDNPDGLFGSIKDEALKMGLVAAHVTPSTAGLRLVFVRPEGIPIADAQTLIARRLNLGNVDTCAKDLARLSFVVPRPYWLHIDYDALFGEKSMPTPKPEPTPVPEPVPEPTPKLTPEPAPKSEPTSYEKEYKGVPYDKIVECLELAYGGKPAHGNRNTQIFSMACMLRYICNDDPVWISQILPTYGESESKWMATIRSACQRAQNQSIPPVLVNAIELARKKVEAGETEIVRAFDDSVPPKMPERLPMLIRHLVKNVPEVCRESVATGVFPALATHLSDVTFSLIDGTKKEPNFMCVNLARQSSGKASVNKPIEYIMADIKEQDDINRRREQEWKDAVSTKGSNKEKPKRPDDLCVQMLVTDMTNAAFVQRMQDAGNKYIYTNLEELDMLKQLQTNGMKDVGKIICLCFDNGTYGQERVGLQSITALLKMRWNWNASSTVEKGVEFFRRRLLDGTLSRVNFCTIVNDPTKPFVYHKYEDNYAATLKPFITNLNLCKGEVKCPQALAMAERLQKRCSEIAVQTEDVIYEEFTFRAVTIAYMKAMVLYIANDMTWEKNIEDFCEWSLYYDLWCKNHFFGDEIREARAAALKPKKNRGQVNMLESLPEIFTLADAQEMRKRANKDAEGTKRMLNVWMFRGHIEYDAEKEMYKKKQ